MKLFLRTITGESFDSSANSNFTEDSKIEDLKQYLQPFFSKSSLNFCFKGRIIATNEDKTSLKDLGIKEGSLLVIAGKRLHHAQQQQQPQSTTATQLHNGAEQLPLSRQNSSSNQTPTPPNKPVITPPLHASLQNTSPSSLPPPVSQLPNAGAGVRTSSFPSDPSLAAAVARTSSPPNQHQVNLDQLASSLSERRASRQGSSTNTQQQSQQQLQQSTRSAHDLMRSRSNSASSKKSSSSSSSSSSEDEAIREPDPPAPVRQQQQQTIVAPVRSPVATAPNLATASDVPESAISQVLAMGFSDRDAIVAALRRSRNNVEAALDILLS